MDSFTKETPVQTHSLPSLLYFYPPAAAAAADGTETPSSQPQPPTGAEIFPRTTLNQTLLPQPPSLNGPLYGQLLPLPPAGGDSESRAHRTVARRITLRDIDTRLNDRDRDQAYGPRIPALLPGQRQSLYDWAPAPTGPGPMYFAGAVEVPSVPASRRESEEVTWPIFGRLRYSSPPLVPSAARLRPTNAERERRTQVATHDSSANRPSSSLRRYIRGQPQRSRSIWASYAADAERERERARQRDRDRELRDIDDAIDAAIDAAMVPLGSRPTASARRSSISRESISFSSCKDLEETLKYLEKLRCCSTVGESLRLALSSGFTRDTAWLSYDGCDCTFDDFLLDTRMLRALETSWLDAGGTFWGSQTTLSSSSTSTSDRSEGYSPNRWTVKVNISGIDYKNLRLNGTMEAYAAWEKHAGHNPDSHHHTTTATTGTSSSPISFTYDKSTTDQSTSTSSKDTMTPIVTYLEGEIIDFRTHTLQTTSYPSTITDDALYWRKLEPFSYYDPDTLIQHLTSKSFLKKLMQEYVLMRWKEKCFIKGGGKVSMSVDGRDDDGDGDGDGDGGIGGVGVGGGLLTIGGFYFVSLRRSDGYIRGFYYDPKSTPYQELVLRPRKRVFPKYEFR